MILPPVLDKYELHAKVGEGPFGAVYIARDRVLELERRLKIMHEQWAADEAFVQHWRQALTKALSLQHPALVTPLDVNEDQGFYFTVLPTWPQDLRQRLVLHGPLKAEEAIAVLRPLVPALQAAHQVGLVHGGLKPSNVLLDAEGRPALTDLGWMQAAVLTHGSRLAERSERLAKSPYVPPEVWRGGPWGPAADVFGLAQLLHELLTGRPWTVSTDAVALAALDAWGDLAPALRAGLHPDPAQRASTPAAWAALLPTLPTERTGSATPPPPPPPPITEPTQPEAPTAEASPLWEPAAAPAPPPEPSQPEFTAMPTHAEAAAAAAQREQVWAAAETAVAAERPASSKRNLWLGCGIFALIGVLLACMLAGGAALAWKFVASGDTTPPSVSVVTQPAVATSPQEEGAVPTQETGAPAANVEMLPPEYAALLQRPPDWADDFSDPLHSGLPDDDEDETGLLDYDHGVYIIHVYPDSYVAGSFFDPVYEKVFMQVRLRLPNSTALGDGSFGLLCGLTDADHYYTFDVSEDGYAGIWKVNGESVSPVAEWEPLPDEIYQILQRGDWLTVQVLCDGDHLALWAEGTLLVKAIDNDEPYTRGQVGMFVNTLSEDDLRVEFDDFALWEIAP